jgi:hypothetical protein
MQTKAPVARFLLDMLPKKQPALIFWFQPIKIFVHFIDKYGIISEHAFIAADS